MTLPQTAQALSTLLRLSATAAPRTTMQRIDDMKAKRGERYAVARFWEGLPRSVRDEVEALTWFGMGDFDTFAAALTKHELMFYSDDEQAVWVLSQDPAELAGWLEAGSAGLGND